jgi:hypothetical protein
MDFHVSVWFIQESKHLVGSGCLISAVLYGWFGFLLLVGTPEILGAGKSATRLIESKRKQIRWRVIEFKLINYG